MTIVLKTIGLALVGLVLGWFAAFWVGLPVIFFLYTVGLL